MEDVYKLIFFSHLNSLTSPIDEFGNSIKTYPTSKLWSQYIRMVLIMLQFLLADRCGNFDLHLKATSMMLPFMVSAGQHNEYDGSEKADFQNEKLVSKTISVVESYVNPFDSKEKELVNIMTSEAAENSIRDSLLAAEENGVRAAEAFVAGQPNPFSKIKVVTMASSLKKGKEQKKEAFSCIQE
ncbi:hypothetical protein QYM36_005422 [Artemia franciscana]|uniref:Uncharacterized protein n=1 Tax=Artemia franciscana TaxID=6661 RepID=A0AA88HZ88_ARTSF|nr:hypothetical protein QYM36_005422 [Artemia franciscana]